MSLRYPKPRKSSMGYIQGTCDRCANDQNPLVKVGAEYVCSTCARTIVRNAEGRKQVKRDEREKKLWDERTSPTE